MSVTSSSLIVGDSGSGKSSLLATLAEWMWEKHKKVSLLYYSDGGGFPSKLDTLIRMGIIRAWKLRTRGEAFETCSKACMGYWPVEFTDPLAGETPTGVKLIPNIRSVYTFRCPKCKTIVDVQENHKKFKPLYECKCGAKVTKANGQVEIEHKISPFFKNVGCVLNDGLTCMNDWIMSDMSDKHAHGLLEGETAAIGGKIISGDMKFSGSNRSHYGFAQIRSLNWLLDAGNIKGLMIGPVFTARVQRATDKDTHVKIYGPQIAGQAKTSDIPAYVGNCLGAELEIDEKKRKEWKLYLTEYQSPNDNVVHLCKNRAEPGTMPDLLTDGPIDPATGKPLNGAKPFTQFNLGYFFELLENATQKTLDETMKAYPDAPGHSYLDEMKKEEEETKKFEQTQKAQTKPVTPGVPRPGTPPTAARQAPITSGRIQTAKPNTVNGPKRGPGRPPKNPIPRPGAK